MTKPIEILHNNFEKKMETLRTIFQLLEAKQLESDFTTVCTDYNSGVLHILCDYYSTSGVEQKCRVVERYDDFIVSHNFPSRLDSVATSLRQLYKSSVHTDDVAMYLRQYNDIPLEMDIKKYDYKTCPSCQSKMTVYPHQSEIRCGSCACTILLKGTVFDETQFYSQEGSIAKRGSYETSRHCRYHLDRILAIKNPNLSPRFLNKAQTWLQENNINSQTMSCEDWRGCLKAIKETKLNEHIPFIRQFFGGESPGRLFHHEQQQLFIDFDKAVQAFEQIKNGESNLKYYPYFVCKILQKNITKPQDRARLQSILDCIHLQRDNTLVNNDRIWRRICDVVPGWQNAYVKTDKNLLYSLS